LECCHALFSDEGRSLAALGVLLLRLLLAIDTFFQQVVELSTWWVLEVKQSMLAFTTRYNPRIRKVYLEEVEIVSDDREMFRTVEAFAMEMVLNPYRLEMELDLIYLSYV
jgi:hypothetical protein